MNNIELRLDARRVTNKLTRLGNRLEREREKNVDPDVESSVVSDTVSLTNEEVEEVKTFKLPSKLRQPNFYQTQVRHTDPEILSAIHYINTNVNCETSQQKKRVSNLSSLEEKGLRWLQDNVTSSKIAICKADKGGSTLKVHPEYLIIKIKEKVNDADLYIETDDIRPLLYDKLIGKWKAGKSKNYVSEKEANAIV